MSLEKQVPRCYKTAAIKFLKAPDTHNKCKYLAEEDIHL